MNVFAVKRPDYECPGTLGVFLTKELAIEFVRVYYPKYRISGIDKPYITYYDVSKSKGKITEKEVENDWKSDCFITEIEVMKTLPRMYLEMKIEFDKYNNEWYKSKNLFMEYEGQEIRKYEDTPLYFSNIIEIQPTDNQDELLNNYFKETITEDMKNYKTVIELDNGKIIDFSTLFIEKPLVFFKGEYEDLKLTQSIGSLETLIDKNNNSYKIVSERVCLIKDNTIDSVITEEF